MSRHLYKVKNEKRIKAKSITVFFKSKMASSGMFPVILAFGLQTWTRSLSREINDTEQTEMRK